MNLISEIGSLLVSNGIALGIKTDIFFEHRPETPDNAICIFEYQGNSLGRGVDIGERKIQILTRSLNSILAFDKAKAIKKFLCPNDDPEYSIDLSDSAVAFEAIHEPFRLEVDNKNRSVYVCNFIVTATSDD